MIGKEELLDYMRRHSYRPLTADELADVFKIEKGAVFLDLLQELENEGKIVLSRKKRYGLPEKMNLVVGRLQGNSKGFAFLIPDEPDEEDVFISEEDLQGALHNDRVIVRLHPYSRDSRRREGVVIRILKRANKHIVGMFNELEHYSFVLPDERRLGCIILIPPAERGKAKVGDKVVVEMLSWQEADCAPLGKVIEVLGFKDDPGVDILSIVRKHQLPEFFPEKVLKAAAQLPSLVSEEDLKGRRDFRKHFIVTIDGEDAKDLDDAVNLELLPNGNYFLGVHIADVGYYVPSGSVLDEEAFKRGTSVYLVDRVIPMLPPALSNGICSLNEGVDRLTLSCLMEIDKQGQVIKHDIVPGVIHVKKRLSYTLVRKILEKKEQIKKEHQVLMPMLELMRELCLILRKKRLQRGAIDFAFPESQVILDDQGKPVEIVLRQRSIAEMIIEEFMIVTNETVAEEFFWREMPFLYRVHEKPAKDEIKELNEFLGVFGYRLPFNPQGDVQPRDLQAIVEKTKGRSVGKALSYVILRSLKHARYAVEALGHFGLASQYYSHFTAPIRRYPDLVIHRLIRQVQKNGVVKQSKKLISRLEKDAEQASLRERVAEEAERESVELKKVEYMQNFIGQDFMAIISSVTSFGFFVELPNTVEGLVHISTLTDDYYHYVEKRLMLIGDYTGQTYRIGDSVKVTLMAVNVAERLLDFELSS